jgi:hypothetical protein
VLWYQESEGKAKKKKMTVNDSLAPESKVKMKNAMKMLNPDQQPPQS